MTGPEVRQLLAQTAQAALPPDWTVYTGPPEQCAFPAAVVVPRSPWIGPSRFCEGVFSAGVSLLIPRSQGFAGMDVVDELSEPVRKALQDLQGVIWEGTDVGPMIAPGGVEAYGSTINLQVMP